MPHESLENRHQIEARERRNQEAVEYYIEHPEELPAEFILAIGQYLTIEAATSESLKATGEFKRFLMEHPEKHAFLRPFIERIELAQNRRWVEDKDVAEIVTEGLLEKYKLQARNRFLRAFDSIIGRDKQLLGTLTDKVEELLSSKMALDQEIEATQTQLENLKEKISTEEQAAHLRALQASKLMLDSHLTEQLRQQEKIEELNRRLGVLQNAQIEKEREYQQNIITLDQTYSSRVATLDSNYHNRLATLEQKFAERETELVKWEEKRIQEIERKLALAEREFQKQRQQYEQEIRSLSNSRDDKLREHGIVDQRDKIQEFAQGKIVTAINERESKQTLSITQLEDYQHLLFALEDLGSFEQKFGQQARSEAVPTIRVAFSGIEPIQKIVSSNQIFKIVVGALDNPEISIERVASLFREAFAVGNGDQLKADNFARALQREYPSLFETSAEMTWLHDGQFIKGKDFEALSNLASANSIDLDTLRNSLIIKDGKVGGFKIPVLDKLKLKDYSSLKEFKNVRHLVVQAQDSEAQTHVLTHLNHLTSITVKLDKTDNFPSLAALPMPERIKSVKIEAGEYNPSMENWLSARLKIALENLPQLTRLSINANCYLHDLNFCRGHSNLEYVSVARFASGGSIEGILSAKDLKQLHLNNWVRWRDVQKLMKMPSLTVFAGSPDFHQCPSDDQTQILEWHKTVSSKAPGGE